MPLIGIVGKTNVGKSTFFQALTLIPVKIENRPFVTIEPNIGIAYVRKVCAHVILNLPRCDPKNSMCIKGFRFIPVKVMDVAGLIKDAHKGKGLGNKFMDDLRQADVLLHVVDTAGSTDENGNPVKPGTHDPLNDIESIEFEVDEWFYGVISRDWLRFSRFIETLPWDKAIDALAKKVSGLSIRKEHIVQALKETGLESTKPSSWREEELRLFAKKLREISKPIVIVANKMDIPEAEDNLKEIIKKYGNTRIIVPTSAVFELALRKAANLGLIDYLPGDELFNIVSRDKLNQKQLAALEKIYEFMKKYGGTGVQQALNKAVFNVLGMITVYPVENPNKFTDGQGNILPDAYLVKNGTTTIDLAYMVHTDLGRGFLYAILAKEGKKVGASYILKDNDVVKIVSTTAKH